MKSWKIMLLIMTVMVLLVTGCRQQPEEALVEEKKGDDDLEQPLERFQALGTPLDLRPVQTATATFALG